MRTLIDKEELLQAIKEALYEYKPWETEKILIATIAKAIHSVPAVERRPIRCWNCIHYNAETKGCKRNPSVEAWEEGDFCNYGEARGEE